MDVGTGGEFHHHLDRLVRTTPVLLGHRNSRSQNQVIYRYLDSQRNDQVWSSILTRTRPKAMHSHILPHPQAGMVSRTIVPCRCSVPRSSGSAAPYITRRPDPEWIMSFRPGFRIYVTVIQRPMPLVGLPVPETSSWTASPMAPESVSGWGRSGLRASVARMPGPESAMTTSKACPLR